MGFLTAGQAGAWWQQFTTVPVVQRLGWTLVHSAWQFLVIAACCVALFHLLQTAAARFRYGVALLGMLAILMAPIATFWFLTPPRAAIQPRVALISDSVSPVNSEFRHAAEARPPMETPSRETSSVSSNSLAATEQRLSSPRSLAWWSARSERWLPTLVVGWMWGVCLLSVRMMIGLRATWVLRRVGLVEVASETRAMVERLSKGMRIRRPVGVATSRRVQVPSVVGYLRPLILLPVSMVTQVTPFQLEAMLAHELAHVRRHDYAVNLVQSLIESLFFYHPAVWWLSYRMRCEREFCCDDVAVSVCGDRPRYANALVAVDQICGAAPQFALAANGTSLVARIRHIAQVQDSRRAVRDVWPVVGLWILLGTLAAMAFSASPEAGGRSAPDLKNNRDRQSGLSLGQVEDRGRLEVQLSIPDVPIHSVVVFPRYFDAMLSSPGLSERRERIPTVAGVATFESLPVGRAWVVPRLESPDDDPVYLHQLAKDVEVNRSGTASVELGGSGVDIVGAFRIPDDATFVHSDLRVHLLLHLMPGGSRQYDRLAASEDHLADAHQTPSRLADALNRREVTLDQNGQFRIKNVPSGRFFLHVVALHANEAEQQVLFRESLDVPPATDDDGDFDIGVSALPVEAELEPDAKQPQLENILIAHHHEAMLPMIDMSDEDLQRLAELTRGQLASIEGLDLRRSKATDAGLRYVLGIRGLKRLWLGHPPFTDAGLARVNGLGDLRNLLLDGPFRDQGIAQLTKLSQLKSLSLLGTSVTESGLADLLARLPNLEDLHVEGEQFGDVSLASVATLSRLRRLTLSIAATDAGLAQLGSLRQLRKLNLNGNAYSDAAMERLKELPTIESLYLNTPNLSDEGLRQLAALPSLRELTLRDASISDEAITQLRAALPELQIELKGTRQVRQGDWSTKQVSADLVVALANNPDSDLTIDVELSQVPAPRIAQLLALFVDFEVAQVQVREGDAVGPEKQVTLRGSVGRRRVREALEHLATNLNVSRCSLRVARDQAGGWAEVLELIEAGQAIGLPPFKLTVDASGPSASRGRSPKQDRQTEATEWKTYFQWPDPLAR